MSVNHLQRETQVRPINVQRVHCVLAEHAGLYEGLQLKLFHCPATSVRSVS